MRRLFTFLALLAIVGMATAQDIELTRQDNGTYTFTMPARNLTLNAEVFSADDPNGYTIAGVPDGWQILTSWGDTVEVNNSITTPLTAGMVITIVPPDDIRPRIRSITLISDPVISGKFTIAASGKQVQFTKGNLQATTTNLGANWTWAFAEHQWDYIGAATANTSISGNGTVTANGTVDLFGWSTANTTYGINNSTLSYSGDFVDWGATMGTVWRTLSKDEWVYLLNTRAASTVNGTDNARYAKGKVNDVQGMILFPDTYTHPDGVATPVGINDNGSTGWNNNAYSSDDWTKMETAGCVFLPAASIRSGTDVETTASMYRTSTAYNGNEAYVIYYSSNNLLQTHDQRYIGASVRLVRQVPFPYKTVDEATAEDKGKLICTAGHIHAYGADAKCTAERVARILYVGSETDNSTYNHGLAMALTSESNMNFNNAKSSCSNKNTTMPVAGATWVLASKSQFSIMLSNNGGCAGLRNSFSSVGGVNIPTGDFWTSTKDTWGSPIYYILNSCRENGGGANNSKLVRATLVF